MPHSCRHHTGVAHRGRSIVHSAGHPRPDGAEGAGRHGADARLRPGAPHRADQQRLAAREPGNHLSLPDSPRPAAMDLGAMGDVREQPAGAVLQHHETRAGAAGGRSGELAAGVGRHRPAPPARQPGVAMSREWMRLPARIVALFRSRDLTHDLDDELDSHLKMLEDDLQRRGLTVEESRRTARVKVGGRAQLHESHREMRGLASMDAFSRDVRGGIRGLVRSPGFAAVVLLTLAVGIGGTTAMFSVIHGVLLRPLEYRDPDALVSIARGELGATPNRYVSLRRFESIRASARSFAGVGAYLSPTEDVLFSGPGGPEVLKGARVSANFLDVLGARPEAGRSFLPDEDAAGAPMVAMISASLWKRRFQSAAGVPGTTVTLNSRPITIVGVLPESFRFPFPA